MTGNAQPLHVERFRVVRMMRLEPFRKSAPFTQARAYDCAAGQGVLQLGPGRDFFAMLSPGLTAILTHAVWMFALPLEHPQSVTFAVLCTPFIAALFGAFWIVSQPRLRNGPRAFLAAWRAPERMALTAVEIVQRLRECAGRTAFHGITILTGNHYSLAHGGRA